MGTPSSQRVLVVDDEQEIAASIAFFLHSKGHLCDRASDGYEALERVRSKNYDVLITDIVMPRMDGITLVQRLSKEYPGLAIMAMSGVSKNMGRPTDREAINAGAWIFIRKPFFLSDFWTQFQILTSRPELASHQGVRG